jgi:hypothetical protein
MEQQAITEQEKMSINLKKNLKQMKKFMRVKANEKTESLWKQQRI